MSPTHAELAQLLGLSADADLTLIDEHPPPDDGRARAFRETRESIESPGISTTQVQLPGLPLALHRSDLDPTVFFAEELRNAALMAGTATHDDGTELELHTASQRCVLAVDTAQGRFILDLHQGMVRRFADNRATARIPLSDRRLPDPPSVGPLPPLGSLSDSLAPWLKEAFEAARDRGGSLGRLEAMGLLLRLWMPVRPEERRALLLAMRRREPTPTLALVRSWLASVEDTALDAADIAAEAQASRLHEDLFALVELLPTDRASASLLANQLIRERDALASIATTLAVANRTGLRSVLRALDRACAVSLASIADVCDPQAALPEDWRAAVSWREPDAWWATGALR